MHLRAVLCRPRDSNGGTHATTDFAPPPGIRKYRPCSASQNRASFAKSSGTQCTLVLPDRILGPQVLVVADPIVRPS